jgi:AraC family transcriptional regulator
MDSVLARMGHSASSPMRLKIEPRASGICGIVGRNSLLEWQVRRVRDYIDAHIGSRILVSDLSHIVQRSEAHFTRAFKITFGETPHAYLTRLRLEFAGRAMLASNAPLTDIALTCGFTDQAHLCRLFRRWIGRTPAEWRRDPTHFGIWKNDSARKP